MATGPFICDNRTHAGRADRNVMQLSGRQTECGLYLEPTQ